jgi:hypothetical protein
MARKHGGSLRGIAASCSLNRAGLEAQRRRYARLAAHVRDRSLGGGTLVVDFAPDVDRAALEEALATERECCPFFRIRFDERSRRLTMGVADAEQEPALAAIAAVLGAP